MKKYLISILVILIAFTINAQTVNPETFPALPKSNLLGKYIYTATGSEGKISLDTIKGYIIDDITVLNGLTKQGDSILLGGDLIQQAQINTNNFPLIINNGAVLGKGTGILNNIENDIYGTSLLGLIGNLLTYVNILTDTINTVGNSEMGISNTSNGDFINLTFSNTLDSIFSVFNIKDKLKLIFEDNGISIQSNAYTGEYLFKIDNILIVQNDGTIILNGTNIVLDLPIYVNDAAADLDSNLPNGAIYKLTGDRTVYQKP